MIQAIVTFTTKNNTRSKKNYEKSKGGDDGDESNLLDRDIAH